MKTMTNHFTVGRENEEPLFAIGFDETLYETVTTMERTQSISSTAAYVIVVSVLLFAAVRLTKRSSLIRVLRVSSRRSNHIIAAMEQITGRKAVQLGSRMNRNGSAERTVQLEIYRLEEVTLKDAVRSIDPEAVIEVTSVYREDDET